MRSSHKSQALAGAAMLTILAAAAPASAQVTAAKGFHVAPFGQVPSGATKPNSIVVLDHHIWVGYGDTAAPDGSSGTSQVIAYNPDGSVAYNLTLTGHNDGLRFDPGTRKLWAVQNEDAIPNVVYIDPKTGSMSKAVNLRPVNGGGYDDEAFIGGNIFVSASNPALDAKGQNFHPALVDLVPVGNGYVPETVIAGNSPAVNTVTGQASKLNLTDPDSLTVTPDGNLLLDDQGDAQLILLRLNGAPGPYISQIPLIGGVQVDDTVFATSTHGALYVTDTSANTIYKITSGQWHLGKPYSASTGVPRTTTAPAIPSFVGELFLDSGATIPVVLGLQSAHGLAFQGY